MDFGGGDLNSFLDPIAKVWGSQPPHYSENIRKRNTGRKIKKEVTKKGSSLLNNSR
ncbi:MAG TPA: hypothetical protein PLC32_06750 [Candidatus Omnitrophota bacterium]|nr:hypothetical protein [Candidatus Omnitrophota bacterium]